MPIGSRHPTSRRIKRLSFAGDGLPERIRSTIFAMLGTTVAAGLGLVLLFSQVGTPIVSLAPLPDPPPVQGEMGSGRGLGPTSVSGGLTAGPGPSARPTSASLLGSLLEPVGTVDGVPVDPVLVRSTLGGGRVAAGGNGGSIGGPGSPGGNSAPSVNSPGESPGDGADAEPAPTPVSGSNTSSGLFVRKSAVKDKSELGDVSEGSPVPTPEPEPPVEPEVPVEPAPEPEVPPLPEGPIEPQAPIEPAPEAEGAEGATGSEPAPGAEESPLVPS